MNRVLPHKIEAVLLYDADMFEFGGEELLTLINGSVGDPKFHFHRTAFENPAEKYLHFFGSGTAIQITHADAPLAPEGFQSALSSDFVNWTFPEAKETVASHKKHIFITVTCGVPMPEMPDLEESLGVALPREKFSAQHFDFAIQMLRMIVTTYVSKSFPSAIHWVQSDRLLSYKQYLDVALDHKDISLLVHPAPFGSGKQVNGSNCIGFRTYGAKNLIGKEIIFNETPVSVSKLYERALQFIEMARQSGSIIPDGESFGIDNDECIRVRHKKDPHVDQDIVELTIEKFFGETFVEQNLEDTLIEKAEAKRASETRAAEMAAIEAAEAKVKRFKLNDSEREDPATRANIAKMRSLAQKSTQTVEEPQKRKKLFGLF